MELPEHRQQFELAPTVEGETLSSVPWAGFLLAAAVVGGGICIVVFVLQLAELGGGPKIAALSRNLLLVLGLSAWLGSYLLFRLIRRMARFVESPDFVRQREVMAAARWLWLSAMLIGLAGLAFCASIAADWYWA